MTITVRSFAAFLVPVALLATGCKAEAEKSATPAPAVVQVGSENVVPATKGTVVVGPIISGELKAEKEANIRAEVGGSMVEVAVLAAQPVQRGAILGRIETRTLEDAKRSASSAVRSADHRPQTNTPFRCHRCKRTRNYRVHQRPYSSHGRQPVLGGAVNDLCLERGEQHGVFNHQERIGPPVGHRGACTLEVGGTPHFHRLKLHVEPWGRHREVSPVELGEGIVRI